MCKIREIFYNDVVYDMNYFIIINIIVNMVKVVWLNVIVINKINIYI